MVIDCVFPFVVQILFKKDTGKKTKAALKDTEPTPVVQMHGMGDFANDPFGMVPLAEAISDYLGGAYVLNVQIGDTNIQDIMNGFIMNLDDQVDYFANVVRSDGNLTNGFNAIGYSQGNLVIRGYIERYNNPPVFNFISMHGPLAGVGSFPGCAIDKPFCRAFAELLGALAYYPFVQEHLAQANYFRDPLKIPNYLAGDRFLADLNNEDSTVEPGVNATYNANWESLNSVCLVKALGDTVVVPNDSEWYGFFQDGTFDAVWDFADTPWYQQDLFGLRSLDKAGKVFFNTTDGNHLDFSTDYLLDLVGIYFE
jgi:palmitoyl-protein thioesterase